MGLDARPTLAGAVNPEVAPFAGANSVTGEEIISSRVGMGRLERFIRVRENRFRRKKNIVD